MASLLWARRFFGLSSLLHCVPLSSLLLRFYFLADLRLNVVNSKRLSPNLLTRVNLLVISFLQPRTILVFLTTLIISDYVYLPVCSRSCLLGWKPSKIKPKPPLAPVFPQFLARCLCIVHSMFSIGVCEQNELDECLPSVDSIWCQWCEKKG